MHASVFILPINNMSGGFCVLQVYRSTLSKLMIKIHVMLASHTIVYKYMMSSTIFILHPFSYIVVYAIIVMTQGCMGKSSIANVFFSLQRVICLDSMLLGIGNEF